jgi:hypothetical protein
MKNTFHATSMDVCVINMHVVTLTFQCVGIRIIFIPKGFFSLLIFATILVLSLGFLVFGSVRLLFLMVGCGLLLLRYEEVCVWYRHAFLFEFAV